MKKPLTHTHTEAAAHQPFPLKLGGWLLLLENDTHLYRGGFSVCLLCISNHLSYIITAWSLIPFSNEGRMKRRGGPLMGRLRAETGEAISTQEPSYQLYQLLVPEQLSDPQLAKHGNTILAGHLAHDPCRKNEIFS